MGHQSWRSSAAIVCLCMLASVRTAGAQTAAPTPAPAPVPASAPSHAAALEKQFLKHLLADQKTIWTSPFRVRGADVAWLTPLAGGTSVLFATDRKTGDAVATHGRLLTISRGISYAGTSYSVAGAAVALWVMGRVGGHDHLRETGLLGMEAVIDTAIVTVVTKTIAQRARPDAGEIRGRFWTTGSSFPSGHSSGIWSLATIVASEYHDRRAVQIAAYGAATLVSLSRFTGQKHYLSDVLVGSAIGFGVGRYVYRARHAPAAGAASSRWPAIVPEYGGAGRRAGLTVTWVY